MKNVLPWVLVAGLSAGLGVVFVSCNNNEEELAKLREQSQQVAGLRAELEETKTQSKAQQDRIEGLLKDNQELLRLRSEIGQLRNEKLQMTKQIQTAQTQAERLQAQAAQAAQAGAQLQQIQAENQQLRNIAVQGQQVAQRNTCINHLRQLDGAKQQRALEHAQTANVIPTPQDVAPYLRDRVMMACPAGGVYALNALSQEPTCSIPGHALPK